MNIRQGRTTHGVMLPWMMAALICLCGLYACGYRMTGTGKIFGGGNTIAVTMLSNRTASSGLEVILTSALMNELARQRHGLVVGLEQAEAILSGTIDGLATETLSRSATLTAAERRLVLTASLTLKDRGGNVLWQGHRLRAEQAYSVSSSKAATEANRRVAIDQAAQRLAEHVYERLTDLF